MTGVGIPETPGVRPLRTADAKRAPRLESLVVQELRCRCLGCGNAEASCIPATGHHLISPPRETVPEQTAADGSSPRTWRMLVGRTRAWLVDPSGGGWEHLREPNATGLIVEWGGVRVPKALRVPHNTKRTRTGKPAK